MEEFLVDITYHTHTQQKNKAQAHRIFPGSSRSLWVLKVRADWPIHLGTPHTWTPSPGTTMMEQDPSSLLMLFGKIDFCLFIPSLKRALGRELRHLFYVLRMVASFDKQGKKRLTTERFYKGRVTSVMGLRLNHPRCSHYNSIHLETKCHFS